jgi:N-acetylglucosamine-6-phosphate deacetylase
MKRLRGLIAHADGSVRTGSVKFAEYIESVEEGGAHRTSDYILPGLIDLQVNGAREIDVMDAAPEALLKLSGNLAREGTTSWLPTALTAPLETIEGVAANVAQAMSSSAQAGSSILGLHLEGPFISARRLGAHPQYNLEPQGAALERVCALPALRMVTLAPELEGALEAISTLVRRGVTVSIGHTEATFEQARAAVDAGARMFTHIYNAMAPLHHRRPGVAAAAMIPSPAAAAVIADGVHVHPVMLRLLLMTRGAGGICLTTDRVAAGASAHPVAGTSGAAVRMPDGRLAGSVISMWEGMRMMVQHAGATVGEAAAMAATNPARVLGLARRGMIEIGAVADMLVVGRELDLKAVFLGGRELS